MIVIFSDSDLYLNESLVTLDAITTRNIKPNLQPAFILARQVFFRRGSETKALKNRNGTLAQAEADFRVIKGE